MNHKKRRPPMARASCALCHPWKINGAAKAKHRRVGIRRIEVATVEQVAEWSAAVALAEENRRWERLDGGRGPRNPWQVPSMDEIRWRLAHPEPEATPEPAWGLMAHAFTRRSTS